MHCTTVMEQIVLHPITKAAFTDLSSISWVKIILFAGLLSVNNLNTSKTISAKCNSIDGQAKTILSFSHATYFVLVWRVSFIVAFTEKQ